MGHRRAEEEIERYNQERARGSTAQLEPRRISGGRTQSWSSLTFWAWLPVTGAVLLVLVV
jgi:hypothetical protein